MRYDLDSMKDYRGLWQLTHALRWGAIGHWLLSRGITDPDDWQLVIALNATDPEEVVEAAVPEGLHRCSKCGVESTSIHRVPDGCIVVLKALMSKAKGIANMYRDELVRAHGQLATISEMCTAWTINYAPGKAKDEAARLERVLEKDPWK